jgi:hypothetical protein
LHWGYVLWFGLLSAFSYAEDIMKTLLRAVILSLISLLLPAVVLAADLENPPVFKADAILGPAAEGPGYIVKPIVGSDGYLRLYEVETPWGIFDVHGDQMMQMRIKEIQALDALVQTANSAAFGDALVKAGLRPVEFAGKLVTDPVDTVKSTVSGVGRMFNSIGSGIRNAGKSQDSVAASVSGAAKQRRIIAYQYGIDPYTDWKPLKEKLDHMSRAAAAGGLVVTGAFILIPGAAGTVISDVSAAGTMSEMVRDYSASQLMDRNRKTLRAMGADAHLIEELLTNTHYTPTDVTAIAGALHSMGKVRNIDTLLAGAVGARSRDEAYFTRRRVELMSARQEKTGEIAGFTAIGNFPFPLAVTFGNGLTGVFPLDALAWTAETSRAVTSLTKSARAEGITGPLTLVITGTATPLAQKKVAALGWKLEQQQR